MSKDTEIAELKAAINGWQMMFKDACAEINVWEDELTKHRDEIAHLNGRLELLNMITDARDAEIAELKTDVAALSKTNRQLIRGATHGIDKADAIREMLKKIDWIRCLSLMPKIDVQDIENYADNLEKSDE